MCAVGSFCLEKILVLLLGHDSVFLIILRTVRPNSCSPSGPPAHFGFSAHSTPPRVASATPCPLLLPFFLSLFYSLNLITWKTVISGFKGKVLHMVRVKMWSCLLILHLELSKHWPWQPIPNGRHSFAVMITFWKMKCCYRFESMCISNHSAKYD